MIGCLRCQHGRRLCRAAAAHKVYQKSMVQRQLVRNKNRLLASCFHLWKGHAQAKLLFKRRFLAMTACWTERISTSAFRAWAEHASSQRQLRALQVEAAEKVSSFPLPFEIELSFFLVLPCHGTRSWSMTSQYT